ncbi:Periplasmic chelated iron-binding protein [Hartmannibacter diazotrophicus]|uniref:Periplasmic chelated iron-binding protein n=1 Tax=Hartmannibacter diazotrophicus TaxID=1482074 RepID=A0A2C9D8F0_9HYPH|nr:metal ABC transporter substrate-binding protein [Hartmannibacter diazotrophicus]SON56408.1 Periplasmic chelated iron-binding protein [Hartmannibacter diazotrophicus]
MNQNFKSGLAAALALLALTASPASAKELKVVASFTVLADVAREIGGDKVTVTSLIGPNGDPHEFSPSPKDAKLLADADVVLVSGLGLEGWMDRMVGAAGQVSPVVASKGIETREMDEDGHMVIDPHVWNSPRNVEVWVDNIEAALVAADPEDKAAYESNASAYKAKLETIDADAKKRFAAIPADKRKLLTSHDAFGYFGKEYGIEFLSPVGLSTESEASAAGVAKLIDQIKKEGVKVYFFENSNDPRLVNQIAEATGAEPGGELYVEALSGKDGPASTYLDMIRYNINTVLDAMNKSV